MTSHLRHSLRAPLASLALVGLALVAAPARAQVIVYDQSGGQTTTVQNTQYAPQPAQPVYAAQPVYVAQPRTRGNLTSPSAFYGRISLGVGNDFFRVKTNDGYEPFSVTSGAALHTDFELGLRFAFVHALHVDFDFDRGFTPSVGGSRADGYALNTGVLGAGYTHFLKGTGLYVSGGVGLGFAWLQQANPSASTDNGTAVGYAIHGRVGYDWTLRMRARIGAAVTLRYLGLSYSDTYYSYEETWRGVSLSGAVSFGWY